MKAFLGTALGKVLIGVLAAAVVAGGGFAAYKAVQAGPAPVAEVIDPTEEVTTTEAPITTEAETTEEEVTEPPTEAPTEAPTAAPTTTKPTTTTTKPANNTITIMGVNTNSNLIDMFGAEPYVIFEWNSKGYWEYKSGSNTDPQWKGTINAVQWTIPDRFKLCSSRDWSDPSETYTQTGVIEQFSIGPGDRLYKIA